jgi:hypothetical protein
MDLTVLVRLSQKGNSHMYVCELLHLHEQPVCMTIVSKLSTLSPFVRDVCIIDPSSKLKKKLNLSRYSPCRL